MDDKPKTKRRWIRFSLRALLLVVTMACVGFGWFSYKVRQAERQREAVAAIEQLGGAVIYEHEIAGSEPPGPAWLRKLLGHHFFARAREVDLSHLHVTDDELVHLHGLPTLNWLDVRGSNITDAGLIHLRELTQLQELYLSRAQITDAGLSRVGCLATLEYLDLNCTPVTDVGLRKLAGLTRLKSLKLWDTNVSDAGCQKLTKILPELSISRGSSL